MSEKNLVILGAKKSGIGAALLAVKEGYNVFVSDYGQIGENYKSRLEEASVDYEEGMHTEEKILNADLVVISPGVPDKAPIIKSIKEKGTELISEIEFASRYTDAFTLAITGSNGKTTTSTLSYEILKAIGLNVCLAGNIGYSFAEAVATGDYDYYVLEISSFQLDHISSFRPNISVLLNITPDHLDRYEYKFENYIDSKFNIAKYQNADDAFIYSADDEVIQEYLEKKKIDAQPYPFSQNEKVEQGAYIEETLLHFTLKNSITMSIYELGLQGKHNLYNSMAAGIAAGLIDDLKNDSIKECLRKFDSLEHRLESVATIRGVEFINDSKATNTNSVWYALETMTKPIVWIAGGVDKGNDYSILQSLVKEKVKAIVCLGSDNSKLHSAFSPHVDLIMNATSMEEAVQTSMYFAEKENVVLLSPACASFDLFENYEDRGTQFKSQVRNL